MKNSNISFFDFCDYFPDSYKNHFSYEGKLALFNYLEQLEDELDEEFECDIIAFCCEYTEYENVKEYLDNYSPSEIDNEKDEGEEDEDFKERIQEELTKFLEDRTSLILLKEELDEGFIIRDY